MGVEKKTRKKRAFQFISFLLFIKVLVVLVCLLVFPLSFLVYLLQAFSKTTNQKTMSFKLSNQDPTYALSSGGNLSSTLYDTGKERFQQSFKLLVCEGIF